MNGIKELLISTENLFKELPDKISLCFEIIDINALQLPQDLFDPEAASSAPGFSDSFLPVIVIPDNNALSGGVVLKPSAPTQYYPAGASQRDKNGTFTIIDGCKRYKNLKKNGLHSISCCILSTPLNPFSSGLLRIFLNKSRPQHIREKILFLSWLKQMCSQNFFQTYAQKLGFSHKDLEQLIPVFSCEPSIKEALFEGRLDISLVKIFLILSTEDQLCFLETFKNLKLSLQTQRELLDWLQEIVYNENKTVHDILADPKIKAIVENHTLNAPQKIEKIHTIIYTRKFPRLSKAQNIWKKKAGALNPDHACVMFVPDPYFEKNQLEIKAVINDPSQAVNIFNKLSKISPADWDTLIYPLKSQ